MAVIIAYTIENYQTLCAAIATGAEEVWYGSDRVRYRSLDEMLRIKSDMERALGIDTTPKRKFAEFTKGTL